MEWIAPLLAVWLVAGGMESPAIAGAGISRIAMKDGVVEISIKPGRPFDWQGIKFVSVKSFHNDPPWFPPTRHQLTFREEGVCEWFQFDYIETGDYEATGDFTVEVNLFGREKIVGVFDPETNLLEFDGLGYIPMIKSPAVTVKSSMDLKRWETVRGLEAFEEESEWGNPLRVRFKWTSGARRFFAVYFHED